MADHLALALRGLHPGADRRSGLLEPLVQGMFVLQATHQPAARAGDAQRVEREVLVLRHPDRHRLEVGEERGTAQVTTARADAALHARRVAGGELPQLDPAVQRGAQIADQGTEVHPVRRGEVDGRAVAAGLRRGQDVVDGHHLHRQAVLADQPLGGHLRVGLAPAQQLVAVQVVLAGQPGQFRETVGVLADPLRGPDALGHLGALVGGHQHPVPHLGAELTGIEVVEAPVPVEADRAEHAHAPTLRGPERPDGPPVAVRSHRAAVHPGRPDRTGPRASPGRLKPGPPPGQTPIHRVE